MLNITNLHAQIENEDGEQTVISLQSDDGESLSFDYQRIAQAKLVNSDELMTATKDKVL